MSNLAEPAAGAPSTSRVAVVIPARNAAATIDVQLQCLAAQDYEEEWDLIVVDNASTDETSQRAECWRVDLPPLILIACDELGTSRARNVGVSVTRAEYVLFCDADDAVRPQWVRTMARALDEFDVVGGRVSYERLNNASDRIGYTDATRAGLPRAFGIPYAVGANLGIRRQAFESIDGFDESFSGGADDMDLCLRAQQAGFSIGFVEEAVVEYRLRKRLRGIAKQSYWYALGGAHLWRKHIDLDAIDPQRPGKLIKTAARRGLRAAMLWRMASTSQRRGYCSDVGWFAGAVVGLIRYRVFI